MRFIRIADCPSTPWKNGAGATRELYKQTSDVGEVLARISIAEISGSQAFSHFPGVDRVIMQLDGPTMTLLVDGKRQPLIAEVPFAFAGEATVHCELSGDGLAHDLNLMCARSEFTAAIAVRELLSGEHLDLPAQMTAVLALTPVVFAAGTLARHDCVIATGPAKLFAQSPGKVAILTASSKSGVR